MLCTLSRVYFYSFCTCSNGAEQAASAEVAGYLGCSVNLTSPGTEQCPYGWNAEIA